MTYAMKENGRRAAVARVCTSAGYQLMTQCLLRVNALLVNLLIQHALYMYMPLSPQTPELKDFKNMVYCLELPLLLLLNGNSKI